MQAKSEDQLSHEKAWLEAENVWLVHRYVRKSERRYSKSKSKSKKELKMLMKALSKMG